MCIVFTVLLKVNVVVGGIPVNTETYSNLGGDYDMRVNNNIRRIIPAVMLQVVILLVTDCQAGRTGWQDSSEDTHHPNHLQHLQQYRILAEPSHQIEVR